MKENELKNMSVSERMQAMERLWDSIISGIESLTIFR